MRNKVAARLKPFLEMNPEELGQEIAKLSPQDLGELRDLFNTFVKELDEKVLNRSKEVTNERILVMMGEQLASVKTVQKQFNLAFNKRHLNKVHR
ncbi:hypothetical protein CVU83_03055 [Candidatus Falkowbacteria bacterium HGW-Falkowbacteria-2]|uniref:Uncharacterized protein n=1 Tax=Candidatus Falkowbacteria bacterium HGW-Falkowbacteria-2 TaxID=2013769 RepID=A0A2N2DY85_9BACT|nr:MAG: hypothetical protein CVU83_03055 [Candidatus Falkowbacteria bacterium HGW-Falkowbacteria-2]